MFGSKYSDLKNTSENLKWDAAPHLSHFSPLEEYEMREASLFPQPEHSIVLVIAYVSFVVKAQSAAGRAEELTAVLDDGRHGRLSA